MREEGGGAKLKLGKVSCRHAVTSGVGCTPHPCAGEGCSHPASLDTNHRG
jgi:hypothetical protein